MAPVPLTVSVPPESITVQSPQIQGSSGFPLPCAQAPDTAISSRASVVSSFVLIILFMSYANCFSSGCWPGRRVHSSEAHNILDVCAISYTFIEGFIYTFFFI